MSQLILVRHGQAAFLSDNYDQLSPLGEEQAGCSAIIGRSEMLPSMLFLRAT